MNQYQQDVMAWDEQHTGPNGRVVLDGLVMYEDGASRTVSSLHEFGPELRPIPKDPKKLRDLPYGRWARESLLLGCLVHRG